MARVTKAKRTVDEKAGTITFTFADGSVLVCSLAEIPAEMHPWLAIRGLSENVTNSYAAAKTVEEAIEAAKAMYATFVKGLRTERVAVEKEDPVENLAEAISRFKTANGAQVPDREKLVTRLTAMAKGERDTLRRTPAIASILAEMKAEKRPITQTVDQIIGEL